MTAAATYTWTNTTNSGDNWSTGGNWSPSNPSILAAANADLYAITVAGSGSYNVNVNTAVFAGAVSITQANATIDIVSGGTLKAGAAAVSGTGAGGTFNMTAGQVNLSGGILAFPYTTIGSSASILGYGTVTNPAVPGDTLTLNGSIEASGGTLVVAGVASADVIAESGSGSFKIDSSAMLSLGNYLTLSSATVNFSSAADALSATGNSLFTAAGGNDTYNFTAQNLAIGTTGGSSTGASVVILPGTVNSGKIVGGSTIEAIETGVTYIVKTNMSLGSDNINFTGGTIWVDTQVCYTAGTRILTDRGEIAVEDIAAGDLVVTLDGDTQALKPVKWVGHRRLDLTTHRKPESAAPIRIVRDAFADNQPHRDLVVSPDHGILIDGQLVPAKLLINGTTITQDRSVKTVTYHHVELDRHAILLAEGLPAESYLDTGNRAFFANAGLALVLHPEFEVNANLKCWENDSCAPLAVTPDVVGPIWHRLSERAAALGYVAPNVARTGDANVHLLADGRELRPVNIDRDRFVFMLPAGVQDLRLVSRASAPRDVVAYHDDPRQLGVLVSRISIRAGDVVHDVPLDHPALSEGWHPVERANGRTWRWTSGAGALPISMSTNPLIIEMKLHQRDTYLLAGIDVPTRIAA